jgi:hypothetical protein
MRSRLNNEEKKVKVSVTINPDLVKIIANIHKNKSKYIEKLIYRDLVLNKLVNEDFEL